MTTGRRHLFDMSPQDLIAWCEERDLPRYRAAQVLEWVYQLGAVDPERMTTLSKLDRHRLASDVDFLTGEVIALQAATDGTRKLLVEWKSSDVEGGSLQVLGQGSPRRTECVMIPSEDPSGPRRTACISSQVGCPVGCRFCASGLDGLEGNLSAGRIVEQVWRLRDDLRSLRPKGEDAREAWARSRITNVVFMGMGEPLANLSNVVRAVRALVSPWGMGISARKITISTVGLPAAIRKLAQELDLPVTLALSLHAPTDEIRRELIPWASYTTIKELLDACSEWFAKTGREITLEYTLLRGVNDRPAHAQELARLAKTLRANVNLIRYNEVSGLEYQRPRTEDVRRFQEALTQAGVNTHIRASRGRDIAAACGQLRRSHAGAASG